jgi:hypothetical protein
MMGFSHGPVDWIEPTIELIKNCRCVSLNLIQLSSVGTCVFVLLN